ncbi:hypothetical protein LIER_43668 [Lithospermum erythrorhizon]|uniref:Uncharacterized protein n=1 Tax=Lithospermum erythrorhizon TaxID=34254 RepID=A0AAV3QL08_LITER
MAFRSVMVLDQGMETYEEDVDVGTTVTNTVPTDDLTAGNTNVTPSTADTGADTTNLPEEKAKPTVAEEKAQQRGEEKAAKKARRAERRVMKAAEKAIEDEAADDDV